MPKFSEIDWDKVTLPRDVAPSDVERSYENAAKELVYLFKQFEKFYNTKRRRARVQMMTTNIFEAVHVEVFLTPNGMFDVQGLLKFVANDDRPLFRDVCTFCYEYFQGQAATGQVLTRFKGLLTYFLCKVGF